jgi:vacuolar-type H+-ATPase subunit I/STV1
VAVGEAAATTGEEEATGQPEPALEVVVCSPEIQDAEPIHSAPMTEASMSSRGGVELSADDLVDPATVARHLEAVRQAEQWMKVSSRNSWSSKSFSVEYPSDICLSVQDVVERSHEKSSMLQGFGDAVLRAEALEDQLVKSWKDAAAMQSKLDTAFAKYHNDIQEMQAKSDDLVRKNKSLCNKNKGTPLVLLSTCWRSRGSLTHFSLFVDLETRVEQLKTSETDLKNLFYWEQEARQVLELDYKELAYECDKHMELRIASDRDLINCYKSLQKLNEDCEKLRAQLKELEEVALPIARLLVPHPGGPKIAPLVDRLKEAPSWLAAYVKHLAKSIPNQVLAFMKSYFPKAPVDVVAGGLAANYTDEQYAELLEQMAPIAEQVADKLNLQ